MYITLRVFCGVSRGVGAGVACVILTRQQLARAHTFTHRHSCARTATHACAPTVRSHPRTPMHTATRPHRAPTPHARAPAPCARTAHSNKGRENVQLRPHPPIRPHRAPYAHTALPTPTPPLTPRTPARSHRHSRPRTPPSTHAHTLTPRAYNARIRPATHAYTFTKITPTPMRHCTIKGHKNITLPGQTISTRHT